MASILFVPLDRFGRDVGQLLAECAEHDVHVVRSATTDDQPAVPAERIVVAVGSVSLPRAREAVTWLGGRWLPATLAPGEIRVGPWMAPGTMCVECVQSRADQHDGSQGRSATARAAWDTRAAGSEPWPWLPPHARWTAGVLAHRLSVDADVQARRSMSRLRLAGGMSSHRVLPRGGCRSCRPDDGAHADVRRSALNQLLRDDRPRGTG